MAGVFFTYKGMTDKECAAYRAAEKRQFESRHTPKGKMGPALKAQLLKAAQEDKERFEKEVDKMVEALASRAVVCGVTFPAGEPIEVSEKDLAAKLNALCKAGTFIKQTATELAKSKPAPEEKK